MVVCAQCGAENPDGFRFCGSCGASLVAAEPPRQVRKVVTALFCDVTGSTALGEELDPEVLRRVLNRYFEVIRGVVQRHGGTVEKFIGDAVMAVFGIPQVREDDALRAVRAAAEIQERLPGLGAEVGVELRFRTGVNTGTVLMGEGENLAVGDAVNVAARLEQAAEPGEVVIGEETLSLVRDAVVVQALDGLELKGKSEPVRAYRLVSVDPTAPGFARHLDVPLVGREDELRVLREAWERVVRESGCHLFTLLGAAGVGKTRLAEELLAELGDGGTILRGRCLPYGEGITFWPLVEALVPLRERTGEVLERLSSGGAATPEELFWDVRRTLEALAAQRPVILHIDDLHWAEPTLLDLLDHVSDLSRGAPILLLCTARPELLEDRPAWAGGKLNATTLLLGPLEAAQSELLLDELGDSLDPEARARVIAASEGNPLFLEEMVALARERRRVEVPPTIQAVLAARLERLAVQERELLERGAIEGEVFHRLAVRALAGEPLASEVELRLAGLVRKDLIRPHPPTLEGDEAFRFRHLLIRDATYDALPKAVRAELHERFVGWLEGAGEDLLEFDEIAGWHLEQAVRYQRELGRAVDPALAARAARHLYAAARKASIRADEVASRNLLERALALAPVGETLHARIAIDLADSDVQVDMTRVDQLLTTAESDPEVASHAAVVRLQWLQHARPRESAATVEATLPGLIARFEADGDDLGLAKAHFVAMGVSWAAAQAVPAGEQAKLVARHARRAGEEGLRVRALSHIVPTLIHGPTHVREMIGELDELEREAQSSYLQAYIEVGRSETARLEARFDDARHWARRATKTYGEMSTNMGAFGSDQLARIERSAGDFRAALEALERTDAGYAEAGLDGFRSTTQAYIAEVKTAVGDRAAAHEALALSEGMAGADDVSNAAITLSVHSQLAGAEGDLEAAERWARKAVDKAFESDLPWERAAAKLQLAKVLAASERAEEAAAEAREAFAIYEGKGDRPGMANAQALLEELTTTS
jgi:class 3 adenylate cyclase